MNKVVTHTYGGMMQDTSKSKFPNEMYFEGRNIRIIATDSQTTGSITNEKGNSFILQIPHPVINRIPNTITYGTKSLSYTTDEVDNLVDSVAEQIIIGHSNSRYYILLFTTNNEGIDCIWKLQYDNYDLTLLYMRDMNFSTTRPIQVLNNFENKDIDKIYWVDSLNQLRFLNIEHSIANQDLEELIDVPLNSIDMVGKYSLSQPIVTDTSSGGSHTAGMIQYAYNLYNINGSQTKISPLSELISLDKDTLGGGAVNEVVSTTPSIQISDVDEAYTNIKVYAIKYTSFNELPSISLIDDREIPSNRIVNVYDDGRIISTISVDEFIFLGSDIIIPKHINSKYNRLFLANYTEINFDVDLDTRAYSYNSSGSATVYKDLFLDSGVPNGTPYTITSDAQYDAPELVKHDSINLNYDTFKYQKNGTVLGGEGKYLKYSLTQTGNYDPNARYFKDLEIYRIGIIFYNQYGQTTDPKWIADFKARVGNLIGRFGTLGFPNGGKYNTLQVTLKPEFFTWLNTTTFESEYDKPVGYKILVANRTLNDRTIVASGIVTPMMVDHKTTDDESSITVGTSDGLPKLPNILNRNCNPSDATYSNTRPLKRPLHLDQMNNGSHTPNTEIQRAAVGNVDTAGRLYQYNTMFQLYSPEILFGTTTPVSPSTLFRVKGTVQNTTNFSWGRVYNHGTDEIVAESKAIDGIAPDYSTSNIIIVNNNDAFAHGLVAHPPSTDAGRVVHNMFYRQYGNHNNEEDLLLNTYNENYSNLIYSVYGTPELTEKGQQGTNYNKDPKFRYLNSLESVLTDGDSTNSDDGQFGRKIISITSYGNRCLTFVLGDDDDTTPTDQRTSYEDLFQDCSLTNLPFGASINNDVGLIGEFIKHPNEIYLGNIYGGNSYSDKLRTNYIEIGDYKTLDSLSPTLNILSPGDTFVRSFRFARIVKTDITNYSPGYFRLEEIIDVPVETSVDLKNRNDLSLNVWDSKFQPQDAEYHSYNKVYSQMPNLITRRGSGYNVKKLSKLDTNVIATKVKHPGEIIDNWTDLSTNDTITLDGKHGSINALPSFNDEIFAIQDKATAYLSINPRVQVQGDDGLSVQLGTGQVLDQYKYVSTEMGTLNKWSVVSSSNGLYFYDAINSSINMTNGQSIQSLTDLKGMHPYFQNHTQEDYLRNDNPIIKKGVASGYDYENNDIFMTFHQLFDSYTIAFSENRGTFTSFYDYIPSMYISKGQHFITTDPSVKKLYRQYAGDYGVFYDVPFESSFILNVNPEPNQDCVFDNINFKSEVYIDNVDQPDTTLSTIRAYNDYQDSTPVNLVVGRNGNIRRKFRDWNASIPREGRNRIRAPWIKLKLTFNNVSNRKLVMHDTSIYYTVS